DEPRPGDRDVRRRAAARRGRDPRRRRADRARDARDRPARGDDRDLADRGRIDFRHGGSRRSRGPAERSLAPAARPLLRRRRRQPLRQPALLRSDRAAFAAAREGARRAPQRRRRGAGRDRRDAPVRATALRRRPDRAARRRLPREPPHGPRARALRDAAVGAVRAPSPAAADDAVGVEGDTALTAFGRSRASDAATFGAERGPEIRTVMATASAVQIPTADPPLAGQQQEALTLGELRAWRGLLRAHACLAKRLDADLERAHRLPLSSYEVLHHLEEAPDGRMRMCDLAEQAQLSRSGLTRLVDRLERDG